MRNTRVRSMVWSGVALAFLLAMVTYGGMGHPGGDHIAFAQGTGQPSDGDEGDDDQDPGQTPTPSPAMTVTPIASPVPADQAAGGQQRPDPVITYLQSPASQASAVEEGDDIDEGLSNQRYDPDDD